jgi:2-polyprenyl-3-methyl-5-hydroxy-6-metoxy-1,4-benzoquinol methylase
MNPNKDHWENLYRTKKPSELSWTEEVPETSLAFIHSFQLPRTARIIDVGGGDSKLAECLLNEGFENITVLDISENSIERSKMKLGKKAEKIKWIVQDITSFRSDIQFDCWHDRATFHFLTSTDEIIKYTSLASQYIRPKGYAVIGTFSENGPEKCSGLPVTQYNRETLRLALLNGFEKLKCITYDHETPFKTKQSFLFCSFIRK